MTYPLPPNTRADRTGNPPADFDALASLMGQLCGIPADGTGAVYAGQVPLPSQTVRAVALTPWRAGLAGRASARCNLVCLGDSITEGQHSTTEPGRWLARLRDLLRARYPTAGLTGGGRGFLGVATSGESSFTWPATLAGSPSAGTTLGPKSQFVNLATSTSQSVTWALVGDSADIMWCKVPFAGFFGWSVDGGSVTTVNTNGTQTDGQVTHVSLGSAGSHTLKVAWASGATSSITGAVEYNGDYSSGIQVHDCGHFGWEASNWVTETATGAAGPAAAIAALKPSAIVITLGVNDQYADVAPATFGSNLQSIIANLEAELATPYPSFILQMLPPRTGQSGYTYPWAQYVAAAWAVAAADTSGPGSVSLVSVLDWTQGPLAPGADTDTYGVWQSADDVHPSNLGHQLIADRIMSWLA